MDWVPRSGTRIVYEDRSVTFRHEDSILRSGVSRTDTRGRKIMNLERCKYTQSNEHDSQMSMVLRLESSCVNLTVIVNDIVFVVATC